MTRRRRIFPGVVFVLCMMICGLVAGALVGGRFLLPPGSGLAGAAIVLGYGILGAVLAGIIGIALAYVLPPKWFLGAALPVTIAGVVFGIVMVSGYLRSQAEIQAHLAKAYEDLPKFRVTLVHLDSETSPFMRMEADWGTRRYMATGNTAEPTTCAAGLTGEEAVALLEALRSVEGVVLQDAFPCAGTLGEVERKLDWFVPEAQPPDSKGRHAITAACAAEYPALDRPFAVAAEIFRNGEHRKECR